MIFSPGNSGDSAVLTDGYAISAIFWRGNAGEASLRRARPSKMMYYAIARNAAWLIGGATLASAER
jgi:hypothetical protein